MKTTNQPHLNRRQLLLGTSCATGLLLSGCVSTGSQEAQQQYSIAFDSRQRFSQPRRGTLIVSPIKIASPFHRKAIYYQSAQYQVAPFAYNQWADSPEKMLDNSLVSVLSRANVFSTVAPISAPISGDYRLDIQINRFIQDFTATPSVFVIDAAVQLYDINRDRAAGQAQFSSRQVAKQDNAASGVQAANQAMAEITDQLIRFLAR